MGQYESCLDHGAHGCQNGLDLSRAYANSEEAHPEEQPNLC